MKADAEEHPDHRHYHAHASAGPLWLAVAVFVALAFFAWVTLDRIKYPLAEYLPRARGAGDALAYAWSLLGPTDLALMAVAALGGLALVVWELATGALSRALIGAPKRSFGIFLGVLLAWFAHAYLHPGYLMGGDTFFHVARVAHFRYAVADGEWPIWNNYFFLGMPFLQFTGPLFFWVGGLLDLIIQDPNLSTKILLFALHMGSAALFYLFLRELALNRFGAMVGAVVYGGAWAHLHLFLYKGTMPQAITMALLPLGLLLVERIARQRRFLTPAWSGFALVSAALIVNHPTSGAFAGLFIIIYVLLGMVVGQFPYRRLAPVITAGLSGIVMTLFVVVPTLLEQQWVTMSGTDDLLGLRWPDLVYFKRLLVWNNSRTGLGSNFDAYLGLSSVLLALWGIWTGLRTGHASRDRRIVAVAAICLILSMILTGPHVREIMLTLFFTAVLAGVGADALASRAGAATRVPGLILIVLFLDLGSTAVQPLARTDKDYFDSAALYLKEQAPQERVLQTSTFGGELDVPSWGGVSPLLYHEVQQIGHVFSYSIPLHHNYVVIINKMAEADLLRTGRLSDRTARLLASLNIARLINDDGSRMSMPAGVEATEEGPLGRVIRVPGASPIVFSRQVTQLAPPTGYDKPALWNEDFGPPPSMRTTEIAGFVSAVDELMGYDPATGGADSLAVRELPQGYEAPADDSRAPGGTVLDYAVTRETVRLAVEASDDGFIRLAHPWHPRLRIQHDGSDVTPLRSAMSLMVLPVHEGTNRYEITAIPIPARRTLELVALGTLVLVLAAPGIYRWRRSVS